MTWPDKWQGRQGPPCSESKPSDAYASGAQKKGRDEDAMRMLLAEIKSPQDAAMTNIVLADSAYT